jgi:hypothetical protein
MTTEDELRSALEADQFDVEERLQARIRALEYELDTYHDVVMELRGLLEFGHPDDLGVAKGIVLSRPEAFPRLSELFRSE